MNDITDSYSCRELTCLIGSFISFCWSRNSCMRRGKCMDADTQDYSVSVRSIGVRVSGLVKIGVGVAVVPQMPARQPPGSASE